MNRPFYTDIKFSPADLAYSFDSVGKHGIITKVVLFQRLDDNLYNLFLSDYVGGGIGDDTHVTDNGDMPMVLSTVLRVILHFLQTHVEAFILISGSDNIRQRLYARIVFTYHEEVEDLLKIYYLDDAFNPQPYRNISRTFTPQAFLIGDRMVKFVP